MPRSSDGQRQMAMTALKLSQTLTPEELAGQMGTSVNWARTLLREMLNLQQVKIVGKRHGHSLYAVSDSSILPLLPFSTGNVPPSVLVKHAEAGVTAKDLSAAMRVNVALMEAMLKFYRNRLQEAELVFQGNTIRKSAALEARAHQREALMYLQELYDAVNNNLQHPNWFDQTALGEMPKSKHWQPVGDFEEDAVTSVMEP